MAEKETAKAPERTQAEIAAQKQHDEAVKNADKEQELRDLITWRARQSEFRPVKSDEKP